MGSPIIPMDKLLITGERPDQASVLEGEALKQRIRFKLSELGLNPHSAARKVDAAPDLIRNILRNGAHYSPRSSTLKKIAAALETTEAWLLTGEGSEVLDLRAIDADLHARATTAAVQSLEQAGLHLEPAHLSELIIRLYELKVEQMRSEDRGEPR